jgi:hypothetical protein
MPAPHDSSLVRKLRRQSSPATQEASGDSRTCPVSPRARFQASMWSSSTGDPVGHRSVSTPYEAAIGRQVFQANTPEQSSTQPPSVQPVARSRRLAHPGRASSFMSLP